jgi:GNAT superfamily N-acetyltransferase
VLEHALAGRHPRGRRHDYLAYLAVMSARQNRGIGTALIRDHHTHLDHTATPAYLEANDPRNHRLYQRLGYTDYGPAIITAGSPPVWPMWYQPVTDRP